MLQLKDISFHYTSQPILDHVHLMIPQGQQVIIMGPSGCGKTTLLKLMAGLIPIQEGFYQLTLPHPYSKSFIFQDNKLVPYLNILNNILLPVWCIKRHYPKELISRAIELLDRFEIADKAHEYPAQLSGGQQQRVGIIRALISDPAIIFADEATGQLDDRTTIKAMNILSEECRAHQCTLVVVTHDRSLVSYADRVYFMRYHQLHDREPL